MCSYRSANRVSRAWRAVAAPIIVSRIGVLAVGLIAALTIGFDPPPSLAAHWRISANPIANLLARWDTSWYLDVATNGYSWSGHPLEQQNVVFFPLLPAMMRIGGAMIGGHPLLAGLIVSLVTFPLAAMYVWRLIAEYADEDTATAAVTLLCAYPFAVFFSAVYTESLFLLAMAGAWYHTTRRDYGLAVWFGIAAGLCRPNGFMLAIPLAWIAIRDEWRRDPRERRTILASLAILAPIAGLVLYSAFLGIRFGNPHAWIDGQAAWGSASWTAVDPGMALQVPFPPDPWDLPLQIAAIAALVLALASVCSATRILGAPATLLIALNVLIPLSRHGITSMGRFTSVLFPIFLWVATAFPQRQRAIVAIFAAGQIAAAILFFTWRPLF